MQRVIARRQLDAQKRHGLSGRPNEAFAITRELGPDNREHALLNGGRVDRGPVCPDIMVEGAITLVAEMCATGIVPIEEKLVDALGQAGLADTGCSRPAFGTCRNLLYLIVVERRVAVRLVDPLQLSFNLFRAMTEGP